MSETNATKIARWRAGNPHTRLTVHILRDLIGADLRYADLRYAHLGNADLGNADLGNADLEGVNLRYANLRSADLGGANLYRANLWYANLRDANLRDANLRSANLRGADLGNANIQYAKDYARAAESAPLNMDTLKTAWENAEAPTEGTPIRDGDLLISEDNDSQWTVWVAELRSPGAGYTGTVHEPRILHRAPREPWQDLADVLRGLDGQTMRSNDELARWLHEHDVRVEGGGES